MPTWNFSSVYVTGVARVLQTDELADSLIQLASTQEATQTLGVRPWCPGDVPRSALLQMQANIVGFELLIEAIEGKRKLSQNRELEDARAVVQALRTKAEGDGKLSASALVAQDMHRIYGRACM